MYRLFAFIIGSWIVLLGVYLVTGREAYSRGIRLDYGQFNALVGCLFITLGIAFFVYALRAKKKDLEGKFVICPQCKEPFNDRDVPDQRCPQCKAEVEELDGFYERHPELRLQNNKPREKRGPSRDVVK